ncbi:hypothetical protein TorRG33x02_261760 [Trema orientale]|uniref:Uncharacterized protein n=1 Tax=Trema orientale TaxID=63057 RepID=A0A2P5D5L6_TREOI|nr:hypothetical protein TorRG33x02_261760 [Trema orientale]
MKCGSEQSSYVGDVHDDETSWLQWAVGGRQKVSKRQWVWLVAEAIGVNRNRIQLSCGKTDPIVPLLVFFF